MNVLNKLLTSRLIVLALEAAYATELELKKIQKAIGHKVNKTMFHNCILIVLFVVNKKTLQ